MRPALWKAAVAGLVLFVLGLAAGVAAIDMLGEEEGATVTRAETATTVETRATTVTRTRTVAADGATVPAGSSLCTNIRARYSIAYPAGWYTTHLSATQACEYFDPRPFEIVRGTEFPPTAMFAAQTDEAVDAYVDQIIDPMFFETVRREETTVAGRRAVLVETIATGEGESEPGERRYGYVLDRDGRAFVVLATGLPGDERYPDFKDIVDQAVESVRFF